jgi:acyl-CoA synthetase (NDP forming)
MPAAKNNLMGTLFHPASIAVIGASSNAAETGWVRRLLDSGYKGKLYPINPKAGEICGLKAYSNICEVLGPIEYAILNIPAESTLQAMRDCVKKSVKFVQCYPAGFAEDGTEEGAYLEAEITKIAKNSGVRLLGPNCMGIYCPESGMTFGEDFPKQTGRIAVVSQSGAEASRLIMLCEDVNLYFNKAVSYGNAADLDAPDFLEYLAGDNETDIVALYIEGVKDFPRFMSSVKKCLKKKPVVILKAGLTASGAATAVCHTASVAGTKELWDAFFKQSGAIQVNTMDEMAGVLQGLTRWQKPVGNRVALVGRGGGIGVVAADICERAGLSVPLFSHETQQKLRLIRPDAGAGFRNPVEPKLGMEGAAEFYLQGLPVIDADENTDFILIQLAIDIYGGHQPELTQSVCEAAYALCAAAESLGKPIAAVLFSGGHVDSFQAAAAAREILTRGGVAVFPGVEAAARAISKVGEYRRGRGE